MGYLNFEQNFLAKGNAESIASFYRLNAVVKNKLLVKDGRIDLDE